MDNHHQSTHRVCLTRPFVRIDVVLKIFVAHGKGTGMWASAYAAARNLVAQMTLDEKVNVTIGVTNVPHNACHGNTGSVPRLGWPGLCLQDAGNGVRGVDFANSYPSGIHVGASWDKNLTYRRGLEMGNEFRRKGGEFFFRCMVGMTLIWM